MEKMTEKEMLEELKTWDDEIWKKFKKTQYKVINLGDISNEIIPIEDILNKKNE